MGNTEMNSLSHIIMLLQHLSGGWLSGIIMQMQNVGSGQMGTTLNFWRNKWSRRTHFNVTRTSTRWMNWDQCCSLIVLKWPRWLPFRDFLTLWADDDTDEFLLPSPTTIAGMSIEPDDKFKVHELGSDGSECITRHNASGSPMDTNRRPLLMEIQTDETKDNPAQVPTRQIYC